MNEAVPYIAADALSDLPHVRHAFFTRLGGVSEGPYASLNAGFGSGDDPVRVAENRRRAMTVLGCTADRLNTAYQVHGAEVARAEHAWARDEAPRADALVTDRPGLALGVLTADCLPVLLADCSAGVVGAAHAGWRGLLAGVLERTVEAMETLGAERGRIRAALGPAIGPASYEVGPEFPAPFLARDPKHAIHFRAAQRPGHHFFDIAGCAAHILRRLGLGTVETLAGDTCAEGDRFFSYRRARLEGEDEYGRMLSAIALAR